VERNRQAALTLLFLSPAVGELISGSSPPLEFFNPVTMSTLVALYGCGALLIREAIVRWQKGVASLIMLGAAYGVYEEVLTVKSWFNPAWMDLGALGHYGRFGGVNWVWAVWLTVYHATISIAFPIFMIDVLFPEFKGKRLLSDRDLKWPLAAFAAIGVIGFTLFPYYPGPEVLVAVGLTAAFVGLALAAPQYLFAPMAAHPARRVLPFAVFGAAWMGLSFAIYGGGEGLGLDPVADILLGLGFTAAVAAALIVSIAPGASERYIYAFLSGCVAVFIAIGIILGFVNQWAFLGQPIVAAVTAGLLIRVYLENVKRWTAPTLTPSIASATPSVA